MPRVNVFGKPIEYDVGVKYVNGNPVPKDTVGQDPGDDLSGETKAQLANWVAEETKKNDYPISDGATEVGLTSPDGTPGIPKDVSNEAEFNKAVTEDHSYSNAQGATFFKKGRAPGNLPNGNELLPNPEPVVTKYTSPILQKNRFTADRKTAAGQDFRINPDHPENTLGNYEEFRKGGGGKDFRDGHFAHIGASLSVRASRELLAATRTGYGPDGPDGAAASAASILPGLSQAGLLKVDMNDLEVKDVLNQIIAADTTIANLDPSAALANHQVLTINADSYGQMNNVLEPFSGLLPLGMIGLSFALTLALKAAMQAVLLVFSTITSANKSQSRVSDDIGQYYLGKHRAIPVDEGDNSPIKIPIPLPASLFGLRETDHAFAKAVDRGMKEFFGGDLGNIGGSLSQVMQSPGFYAVFCRSIVMSAATIVNATKAAIKGNPIQIAENIIALVDIIKSSKIVSAMNMFAQIGDASLSMDDTVASVTKDGAGGLRVSTIDALPDQASSGYKNRLNGSLKLAWGNSNSPSAMLIPQGFLKSLSVMGKVQKDGISDKMPVSIKNGISISEAVQENRLDKDVVKRIEAELDAEYMPFYFHDLRTNEIIAFPAFLSALSDNFSANYETGEYYGRVDPVRVYKSTQRKINISFMIASTGPDDFDQMWVKINKLLTMVYPQWTQGTVLNNVNDNVKFVQPFSQLPGAGPLVRIRLGDLLRSNYSRFALARLFGIGTKDSFKIADISSISTDPSFVEKLEKAYELVRDPAKANKGFKLLLEHGTYSEAADDKSGPLGAAAGAVSSAAGVDGGDSTPKKTFQVPYPIVVKVEKNLDGLLVVSVDDPRIRTDLKITKNLLVPASKLHAHSQFLDENLKNELGSNTYAQISGNVQTLENFFGDSNSIVRSFESVGGKGLACQIDSMNFSWLDNFTWETAIYGSRAPKMCRVTMDITPIHDIAPGISADGFNRAPVYNVGGPVRTFGGDANDIAGNGKKEFDKSTGAMVTKLKR